MSTLTIHALDPVVEKRIREIARREGRSLNQTLKTLLAQSVGVTSGNGPNAANDFEEFCGVWSAEDCADFEAAIADLQVVDVEDWQ